MAKFGRFDYRNKKKDRNKNNSINRVNRIRETEDDFDKKKFKQAVEKNFSENESPQES
jgi:hypothetical protein